jgi:hypothetical protein
MPARPGLPCTPAALSFALFRRVERGRELWFITSSAVDRTENVPGELIPIDTATLRSYDKFFDFAVLKLVFFNLPLTMKPADWRRIINGAMRAARGGRP